MGDYITADLDRHSGDGEYVSHSLLVCYLGRRITIFAEIADLKKL